MSVFFLENKKGERMAIVTDASLKNKGVLVLVDRLEKSGPFVIFEEQDKKYPIVSLRQPPELCGIDEPELIGDALEQWTVSYRNRFCESLQDAYIKSGVEELLIVGGSQWELSSYAPLAPRINVGQTDNDLILGSSPFV